MQVFFSLVRVISLCGFMFWGLCEFLDHHQDALAPKFSWYETSFSPMLPGMPVASLQRHHRCGKTKCRIRPTSPLADPSLADNWIRNYSTFTSKMGLWLVSERRKEASAILLQSVIMNCLPGDVVETGVYTGGSTSVMMKVLMEFDNCNRKLYVFDSFKGLPNVNEKDGFLADVAGGYAAEEGVFIENLKSVAAWDNSRIVISKGWFNETLMKSPVQKIALLRLDGDLYSSTMDALVAFYPKLMDGGYIYIDDFGSFNGW
jgi:hypothetical protein